MISWDSVVVDGKRCYVLTYLLGIVCSLLYSLEEGSKISYEARGGGGGGASNNGELLLVQFHSGVSIVLQGLA